MTPNTAYTALVANGTNILLTLSPFAPAIVFLSEIILDTHMATAVNFPNYLENFPIAELDPETYSQWTWSKNKRLFVSTRPELAATAKEQSVMATNKCNTILSITRIITTMRTTLQNGVSFQETVYAKKATEAEHFKAVGFPENDIAQYPYVAQFAKLQDVSPRAAAESILVKAHMDDEILLRTEMLRIKYSKKIKGAQTKEELDAIVFALVHDEKSNALA